MNSKNNRFYLQALGVSGLFVAMIFVIWIVSAGPASEAEVRNADSTKTAIAMTAQALLGPFPTSTGIPAAASASPTVTSTVLFTPATKWTFTLTPPVGVPITGPSSTPARAPSTKSKPAQSPQTFPPGPQPTTTQAPVPLPTNTLVPPPTRTPIPQPTNTPAPTEALPTLPPATNPPAATDPPTQSP